VIKLKQNDSTRIGIDARRLIFTGNKEKKNHKMDEKIKIIRNTHSVQATSLIHKSQKTSKNHAPILMAMLIAVQPGRGKSQAIPRAGPSTLQKLTSNQKVVGPLYSAKDKRFNIALNINNKKGAYQGRDNDILHSSRNEFSFKEMTQRRNKKHYGRGESVFHPPTRIKKGQKKTNKKNALDLSEDFPLLARVKKDVANQFYGAGSGFGSGPQRTDKASLNPAKIPPIVYDQDSLYIPPINNTLINNVLPFCPQPKITTSENVSLVSLSDELGNEAWSTTEVNWNNKIAEYYILSNQKESIRLLGLNAWVTKHTTIDVKLILHAFIHIFKKDILASSHSYDIDSYEYSILINTMFRDMYAGKEKDRLITGLMSMTNRSYWISNIFYNAINSIDGTLLLPSINSFYRSLNKDTTIGYLSVFHYRELNKLNQFHSDSSSRTGTIKTLSYDEFEALKHIFNSQIIETFP